MRDILNIYYKSVEEKINRRYPALPYQLAQLNYPKNLLRYDSHWGGLESIILNILIRFEVPRNNCLEFGTEYGYSAVALSNYFYSVTCVDTFERDVNAGKHTNNYNELAEGLSVWENIQLIKSDFRYLIAGNDSEYDLIYIDIVHNFTDTYDCDIWASKHSQCTVFHDTQSYPEVNKACYHLAEETHKKFYNYEKFLGLGIIV
ncbi:class I SAM-dependent methyltransferase [Pedobacter jejuensis]|uniref:Class I SAM-dependent methyltransferase n=1 Tax=Pedobacter jejuensis TaxID=1268550 RepID=A0A3N0BWB2_9SPHI|nr:class I SAM-dependent methyltransferase [Pedobacter jejuensis]RNL53951.1 class I SAM-dependent methyltransferase [Pedobacter jejuensis]